MCQQGQEPGVGGKIIRHHRATDVIDLAVARKLCGKAVGNLVVAGHEAHIQARIHLVAERLLINRMQFQFNAGSFLSNSFVGIREDQSRIAHVLRVIRLVMGHAGRIGANQRVGVKALA